VYQIINTVSPISLLLLLLLLPPPRPPPPPLPPRPPPPPPSPSPPPPSPSPSSSSSSSFSSSSSSSSSVEYSANVRSAGEGHADPAVSAVPRLRSDEQRSRDTQPVPPSTRRAQAGAVRADRDRVDLHVREISGTQGMQAGRQLHRFLRHYLRPRRLPIPLPVVSRDFWYTAFDGWFVAFGTVRVIEGGGASKFRTNCDTTFYKHYIFRSFSSPIELTSYVLLLKISLKMVKFDLTAFQKVCREI